MGALKYIQNKHLIRSAEKGDMKGVVLAVKLKALINTRDKDGWTAIMHAFANYHADIVEYLKLHGAKMNMEDQINAQIGADLSKVVKVIPTGPTSHVHTHVHKKIVRV